MIWAIWSNGPHPGVVAWRAIATDFLRPAGMRWRPKRRPLLRNWSTLSMSSDAHPSGARRWLAYEKAEAERDKLADELARVYPPIAEQLAELAARMAANDKQIDVINEHARPLGAKRLLSAEEMARGLRGFVDGYERIPRITKDFRVPGFARSDEVGRGG